MLNFSTGISVTKPVFSASTQYQKSVADSLLPILRDSLIRSHGFNYQVSLSFNLWHNLYFDTGIMFNKYSMTTHYTRDGPVSNIDSTLYLYKLNLRAMEFFLGLTYKIPIKRSHLFAGLGFNFGRFVVKQLITTGYDWYSAKEILENKKNIACDKFYYGTVIKLGFSQYINKRIELFTSYQQSHQISALQYINNYYRLRFYGSSLNLGLTVKM